jgi:hypothetical protein
VSGTERRRAILDDLVAVSEGGLVEVAAWADPVVDVAGVDPTGSYAETYWLPIIGPTALWAARRLSTTLASVPEGEGLLVSLPTLAAEIGLSTRLGRDAPLMRTLCRLALFRLVRVAGRLEVRRRVPPLSARLVDRLPPHLALVHTWPTPEPLVDRRRP